MNYKKLSILFIAVLAAFTGFAQSKQVKTDDLLFLLRQPGHITQALKTVDQLKSDHGASKTIKVGKTGIVICGEAVKDFAGTTDNAMVAEAKRLGVTLYGCGLSLKKFELSKNDLMPGVQYVENGFIKAFELQKQGYLSIEL